MPRTPLRVVQRGTSPAVAERERAADGRHPQTRSRVWLHDLWTNPVQWSVRTFSTSSRRHYAPPAPTALGQQHRGAGDNRRPRNLSRSTPHPQYISTTHVEHVPPPSSTKQLLAILQPHSAQHATELRARSKRSQRPGREQPIACPTGPAGIRKLSLESLEQGRLPYTRLTCEQYQAPITTPSLVRILGQRGQERFAFEQLRLSVCHTDLENNSRHPSDPGEIQRTAGRLFPRSIRPALSPLSSPQAQGQPLEGMLG